MLAWRDAREMRYIHLGVALIFGVLLALEYVVVSGDVGRMNTVFKISFQLWIWVGAADPAGALLDAAPPPSGGHALMLLLVGAGLLYPVFAIPARYDENLVRRDHARRRPLLRRISACPKDR